MLVGPALCFVQSGTAQSGSDGIFLQGEVSDPPDNTNCLKLDKKRGGDKALMIGFDGI